MKRIPKTAEDFAWVSWSAQEIDKIPELLLNRKKERYEAIKAIPADKRTFENSIYGIEAAGNLVGEISLIEILMQVSPKNDVRKAAELAYKKIQDDFVDLEYDPEMYRVVKEFAALPEATTLEGEDKVLFEDMLRDYRRMGFDLPVAQQARLKEILKRLQKLATEFTLNVNNYKDQILIGSNELDGLPENFVKQLDKDPETGKYIISIKSHELGPFMENSPHADRRKELSDKSLHKGGEANIDILKEVLDLRREEASMLGYPTYVDFAAEPRMAKNAKTIRDFLDDLFIRLDAAKEKDLQDLTAMKRELTGDPNAEMLYYDFAYYITKLEKKLFNFDKEKVREYFKFETVFAGMIQVFETLFSITLEEAKEIPTWHTDVKCYEVRDRNSREVMGYVFLDIYPRDNKYSHPSMWPIMNGHRTGYRSEEYFTPAAVLLGNFPKSTPEIPSLLSHGEVETLFHEFGHILHGILTTASYSSQSGTSVAWDFVEVPSQMLEHWVWDKDVVTMLSGHYQTGEKLPAAILDNMIKSKNLVVGYVTTRQLILGLYNHLLHTEAVPKENIGKIFNDLNWERVHLRLPEDNLFAAGFGHLIGYAGAYYSYLWSNVYECDLFTRFKKEGILNSQLGKEYRDKVLAVGSSRDELETVKDFLGREPNNEAFLKEIGVE